MVSRTVQRKSHDVMFRDEGLTFRPGHISNAPPNYPRFGARGTLDGERGLGMGHAPNSAERRRHGELGGVGKHIGGLSSGIKVSQPMGTNGLQHAAESFMGIRDL